jgi:hypothetical protein
MYKRIDWKNKNSRLVFKGNEKKKNAKRYSEGEMTILVLVIAPSAAVTAEQEALRD